MGRLIPGLAPPWELPDRKAGQRYLYLVRHGRAAAGFGDDVDPGLSEEGRRQAEAVAVDLASLGPLPLVTSPLRRCRETAAPLAERWGTTATVEPGVGEIVAPADEAGLEAWAAWLETALASRWSDLGAEHRAWRARVVETLLALQEDTVVVTHFVAINVAVGAATDDDRVVSFSPGNCSRTVLRADGDRGLAVLRLGDVAATEVL